MKKEFKPKKSIASPSVRALFDLFRAIEDDALKAIADDEAKQAKKSSH